MVTQDAKLEEESALDAKRRRRFGAAVWCLSPATQSDRRLTSQGCAERDPLHQGKIVERSKLGQRNFSLDLTSRLGKTQVVTNSTPLNQQVSARSGQLRHCRQPKLSPHAAPAPQAGYYCSVCDCILRDSQSYLDHINGKWHNRALGMSMRVERVSADEVCCCCISP